MMLSNWVLALEMAALESTGAHYPASVELHESATQTADRQSISSIIAPWK
jgi:hypothetical protein